MPRLKLHLLTPLPRLLDHTGEIGIVSKKGLALLAYLAMQGGEPVSRSVLAGLLWSDRSEAQARQSLRQTLHTLRPELGEAHAAALSVDDASVAFKIAHEDVDALHFAALAQSSDPTARLRCLDMAWRPLLEHF